MENDHLPDEVPVQQEGSSSDTEASKKFEKPDEAKHFYLTLKKRLLDVNNWHSYSGAMTAEFALCNNVGEIVNREIMEGDHFRINIPGPGLKSGEGYDWVKVLSVSEKNSETTDQTTIQVKPCTSPVNDEPDTAHFFKDIATSTFIALREGNMITAGVYGRNEIPNTDAAGLIDKARNAVIGAVGIGFFSKFQWKKLVTGLIES